MNTEPSDGDGRLEGGEEGGGEGEEEGGEGGREGESTRERPLQAAPHPLKADCVVRHH